MSQLMEWVDSLLVQEPGLMPEDLRLRLASNLNKFELSAFRDRFVTIPAGQEPVRLKGKSGKQGKQRVANKRTRYTLDLADKNLHQAQAAFVVSCLGINRFKELVREVLLSMMEVPGSKLIKKSDRDSGKSSPSREEVSAFVDSYFSKWHESEGLNFDVGKITVFWEKYAIWRIEATIDLTYCVLRLLSYRRERWARWYQEENSHFQSHFLRRVRDGQYTRMKAFDETPPAYLLYDDDKKIRQLDPMGLVLIIDFLTR